MLATYVHDLSPLLFKIHVFGKDLAPRWYGLAYVLSFLVGYWLYRWLARNRYTEMPEQQVGDFITWAAVFGVMLGGRVGWLIFYGWREVLNDPRVIYRVWEGGMSSHGGILALVLFTLYWARTRKISWTSIGDSLCSVAPVGLFFVRCANFINGELWGKPAGPIGGPATIPWAVAFPTELGDSKPAPEVIRADPELRQRLLELLPPRHPSQLYEALLEGVLLFALLWFIRTRIRVPRGIITGTFFIAYAMLRIIGEMFREPDPAWSFGPFSAGQFLSLFMFAIGAAFYWWAFKTRQYEGAWADEVSAK